MLTKRDLLRFCRTGGMNSHDDGPSLLWRDQLRPPGFIKAKDIAEAGFIFGCHRDELTA